MFCSVGLSKEVFHWFCEEQCSEGPYPGTDECVLTIFVGYFCRMILCLTLWKINIMFDPNFVVPVVTNGRVHSSKNVISKINMFPETDVPV